MRTSRPWCRTPAELGRSAEVGYQCAGRQRRRPRRDEQTVTWRVTGDHRVRRIRAQLRSCLPADAGRKIDKGWKLPAGMSYDGARLIGAASRLGGSPRPYRRGHADRVRVPLAGVDTGAQSFPGQRGAKRGTAISRATVHNATTSSGADSGGRPRSTMCTRTDPLGSLPRDIPTRRALRGTGP